MNDIVAQLFELGVRPEDAAVFVHSLDPEGFLTLEKDLGSSPTQFWRYAEDPAGFIGGPLNETLWSVQGEILTSVRDNVRTAVPACHSPGKTHLAARIVAWWVSAWPLGTAQAITTATTYRTVRNQLWPHIRRAHSRHDLPGRLNLTEWWIYDELVAYGFSSRDQDPESIQGIHVPHLLIVVDEAGGISHTLGGAFESLLSSGHVRIVLFGNPSIDEEGTWFQRCCESPRWNTIPIPAEATPNFSGEVTGPCRSCPRGVPEHPLSEHLLTPEWVETAIEDHGEDSPFVIAKVKARFPEVVTNRVIPYAWVERAKDAELEEDAGTWVRIGVDVASDGGDELAIVRAVGLDLKLVHHSAGAVNANSVDVAGEIKLHVLEALEIRARLGETRKIRVKIDSIGVGWGVASTLETWIAEDVIPHDSVEIVRVNVSESAGSKEKFADQKAEMWWTMRQLLQESVIRLEELDHRSEAQFSSPTYTTNSRGQTVIESKKSLKARGLASPDRAEAFMLAVYEPPASKKRKVRLLV